MWAGFNSLSNPLLPVLERASGTSWRVVGDERIAVDLEVASVFPSRASKIAAVARAIAAKGSRVTFDSREALRDPGKSSNAGAGIWYTGENVRPPASGWDAYLSYENEEWPTNAYLPLWYLHSDLFGGGDPGFLGRPLVINELVSPRPETSSQERRFCCAIFRNPEPVRLKAIELLRKIGPVDIFGQASGRPVANKFDVMTQYRFALCFENDLYPGYITEKVFDPWISGAIPLYWGIDSTGLLNGEAMLNLADHSGLETFVDAVAALNGDPDQLSFLASQPILRRKPDAEPTLDLIREALAGLR